MKTVLLTGATGFLGSHLLEALIKEGYQVVILKRSTSNTWRIKHLLEKVISYDVDRESLEKIFQEQQVDCIVHLATLYRKFDGGREVSEMIDSNVSFPVELLESSIRFGLKGFINTGTFFEYDCSRQPVNENALIHPFNLYAKTKLAFESILKSYANKININTFRLFSPYGERDNFKLIPMLIQKALSKQTIQLSDGMQKLDFTYVLDIVDAYMKALKNMELKNHLGTYNIFNLGSGVPISVREVVSIIEQNLGESLDVVWGEPSTVDIPIAYADLFKIKKELSWSPGYSIHQGIANTIDYYREKDSR